MTIVSAAFAQHHPDYRADIVYPSVNGVITGTTDVISLIDANKHTIDSMSWTSTLTGGMVLERHWMADLVTLADTDTVMDFSKIQGVTLPAGTVYEVIAIVDECVNLPAVQDVIPTGYMKNELGDCLVDVCSNIEGLQAAIPEEYLRSEANKCMFDYVGLQITELLPNAAGSDTGREYIELYNPTDREAFLVNYQLLINGKTYNFPASLKLNPGQYMAFYNNEITFTFLNTSSHAALMGDDGTLINESDAYDNPKEDMAWAVIDGVWQYTNQMTFATANAASLLVNEDDTVTGLAPCASNQYRHPETNRCRLLVGVTSVVAACKDGQYRSEETNRCRTIALAGGTLTPCKDGQYRSEETNRCRNMAIAASTLTPCKDNQYRSEETNRCRTILNTNTPAAAFAVTPIADTDMTFVGWWVLGGIGIAALGYAVWEWHFELLMLMRRFASFFTKS
jgi:hypothetical protein